MRFRLFNFSLRSSLTVSITYIQAVKRSLEATKGDGIVYFGRFPRFPNRKLYIVWLLKVKNASIHKLMYIHRYLSLEARKFFTHDYTLIRFQLTSPSRTRGYFL